MKDTFVANLFADLKKSAFNQHFHPLEERGTAGAEHDY